MTQPTPWPKALTETIASQIQRTRVARGMSAQQLADATASLGYEIPRSVIANLESGRRDTISVAELMVLGRALQVPPVSLVFPIGLADSAEVVPGTSVPTWAAAKWFSGEAAWPSGPLDGGGWGVGTGELEAWKASVPLLFRQLDQAYGRLTGARRNLRDAEIEAAAARGSAERHVRGAKVEFAQDILGQAEQEVRRLRELIRQRGMDPGPLLPEYSYLDEATNG